MGSGGLVCVLPSRAEGLLGGGYGFGSGCSTGVMFALPREGVGDEKQSIPRAEPAPHDLKTYTVGLVALTGFPITVSD